jgi:hypothetical protein
MNKRKILIALFENVYIPSYQQFTPFVDHNIGDSAAITEGNILRNILHVKKGEDWRRARNCISPAFSTGKLKKVEVFGRIFQTKNKKF